MIHMTLLRFRDSLATTVGLEMVTLTLIATIYWGCGDKLIAPPVKDFRTLAWTVDTISYPGSVQTAMADIWGSSPTDIYVVGHNDRPIAGTMFHFDGSTWKTSGFHASEGGAIAGSVDLRAIAGFSPGNLIVVGERLFMNPHPPPNILDSSLIISLRKGLWHEETIQVAAGLQSVSGRSMTDVWACGRGGLVYHYDGLRWQSDTVKLSVPTGGEYYLWDIRVSRNSPEVFLLGYIHQNDLAKTTRYFFIRQNDKWVLKDSMIFEPNNVIEKFGENGLWVSPEGTLYSFGSGVFRWTGSSWIEILSTGSALANMSGTSDRNILAVGDFGEMWHYNGSDWYEFRDLRIPDRTYSAAWTDGEQVFVCGFTYGFPQRTVVLRGR